MQNRDYYTMIELIMALRGQYLKSQELLNTMKRDIKITADEPFDYNLSLFTPFGERTESEIMLRIHKDYHSGIGPYMRHILSKNPRFIIDWHLDNAAYLLGYNDKYYFEKKKNGKYNPDVIIPDYLQADFANSFQELQSLDLYRLPETFISNFNPVHIEGDCIHFTNHDKRYDVYDIYYNAVDDKIYVRTYDSGKVWAIHYRDLFNSQIPCYKIPKEYLEFLEKTNPKSYSNVGVREEDYIKHSGKFEIKENEDKIVLSKVLKTR